MLCIRYDLVKLLEMSLDGFHSGNLGLLEIIQLSCTLSRPAAKPNNLTNLRRRFLQYPISLIAKELNRIIFQEAVPPCLPVRLTLKLSFCAVDGSSRKNDSCLKVCFKVAPLISRTLPGFAKEEPGPADRMSIRKLLHR